MISIEEARKIVMSQSADWGNETVSLEKAVGRVLAEEVQADRDFPPFDRVTMDGIAIRHESFANGKREFALEAVQFAGEPVKKLQNPEAALEVMTGAVLPDGCDTVIRYEDVEIEEGKSVRILIEEVDKGKNVHSQGSDSPSGECLLRTGQYIDSGVVAILATVGKTEVIVKRTPMVAIVSTGDELVDVEAQPLPHQIRKSNTVMMQAALNSIGIDNDAFHLLDKKEDLRKSIAGMIEDYDVILLSGGVSKGKADYVPEILGELGVEKKFHRVAQRPGKPFWFGAIPGKVNVFALPGNPISTLMCFRVYFMEWLRQNIGLGPDILKAELSEDFTFQPDLGYFLQVSLSDLENKLVAKPEVGRGSGDLVNLAVSDAFLYLPSGKEVFNKGEVFDLFRFP